jgi:hypothetical protein
MELNQVLALREGSLIQWAREQLIQIRDDLHDVLLGDGSKLEKVQKLMNLLPPGCNICGFHALKRDGTPIVDAMGDLRNLRGFCLRRNRHMSLYSNGETKPRGFIGLVGSVEDRLSGHVYFGDGEWVNYKHIPVVPSVVGHRYDILQTGPDLRFHESQNPGVLDIVLQMFQRVADDDLNPDFEPPALRAVVSGSRRNTRLWMEDDLFHEHLAAVVRTGSWGIEPKRSEDGFTPVNGDIGPLLQADGRGSVSWKNDEIHFKVHGREEIISHADVTSALELEIKEVFGESVHARIEPTIPKNGSVSRDVSDGFSFWRPEGVVPIASESVGDTIARLSSLGMDKFDSDRRFRFIAYWAALTTMQRSNHVATIDGAFVSTGTPPRVCALKAPVVFVRYGREGSLSKSHRVNNRDKLSVPEFDRLRTRWRSNNLLLTDYDSPAGFLLSQMEERKPKSKVGVRFTPVSEVASPATGS